MRLWKSCLRDGIRKGKYFSRKSIKVLCPQPKKDETESERLVRGTSLPPGRGLPDSRLEQEPSEHTSRVCHRVRRGRTPPADGVSRHPGVSAPKEMRHKVQRTPPHVFTGRPRGRSVQHPDRHPQWEGCGRGAGSATRFQLLCTASDLSSYLQPIQ